MYNIILATLLFIVFDFLSGLIGAIKNKEVKSSVLREGLFHKAGFVLMMVLACALEYYEPFILKAFIPLKTPTCYYIIITEVTSILENIQKINPNILPEKVTSIFGSIINKDGE